MTTACLRRHFDTLQSTGNGSSLLELQRAPNALSLLQALLQEELAQEPPPVAPPGTSRAPPDAALRSGRPSKAKTKAGAVESGADE